MTWRERIQAARERGHFTEDDMKTWQNPATCLLGETATKVFGDDSILAGYPVWRYQELYDHARETGVLKGLMTDDFDAVERGLDLIEDAALALKREAFYA